uniref:Bm6506 n=1 Tax=Brugia malayi TaxID=6279 RepID=A0A0J9XR25_BRUMA|nr:Bm6506 [Brugia malayi]
MTLVTSFIHISPLADLGTISKHAPRLLKEKHFNPNTNNPTPHMTSLDIYNIHCCNCLSFRVLTICYSVTYDILQKHFQYATCLFINQSRNTFHTTTSCQTSNSWLCYSLNIVTQHFTMTLRSTFSKSFTAFTTS